MSINVDNIPAPIWVSDDASLVSQCEIWSQTEFLALDTEFIRTSTFYPKPGLLQLATEDECWLIDPLEIHDWSAFKALMDNPNIVKVFHSCAEDLEVCMTLWGSLPTPLFDTQLAMAFAGLGQSVGFQRAIDNLLGIEISKEATRSNWLQRPLTDEQVEYAVADVHYLRQIYPILKKKVADLERTHWLEEDCARLIDQSASDDNFELSYRKVKLGWKLNPQEQYVLQQLACWREKQARSRNVPRNRIADDRALWNIARYKSSNKDQLRKAGLHPAVIKSQGVELIAMVASALNVPDNRLPQKLDRPLSIEAGNVLKELKRIVTQRAEALAIPPELLANKRLLEPLVRGNQESSASALLHGWRLEQIGNELRDASALKALHKKSK